MDNINYNPNNGKDGGTHPSGNIEKFPSSKSDETAHKKNDRKYLDSDNAPLYPKPHTVLHQLSTTIDNSSNLSRVKKLFGICLACLAVLLVIIRWSQQDQMIQSNQDRYLIPTPQYF